MKIANLLKLVLEINTSGIYSYMTGQEPVVLHRLLKI